MTAFFVVYGPGLGAVVDGHAMVLDETTGRWRPAPLALGIDPTDGIAIPAEAADAIAERLGYPDAPGRADTATKNVKARDAVATRASSDEIDRLYDALDNAEPGSPEAVELEGRLRALGLRSEAADDTGD